MGTICYQAMDIGPTDIIWGTSSLIIVRRNRTTVKKSPANKADICLVCPRLETTVTSSNTYIFIILGHAIPHELLSIECGHHQLAHLPRTQYPANTSVAKQLCLRVSDTLKINYGVLGVLLVVMSVAVTRSRQLHNIRSGWVPFRRNVFFNLFIALAQFLCTTTVKLRNQ